MTRKILAVLAAILALVSFDVSAEKIFATVPFANLRLLPKDTIEADYVFGTASLLYCYEKSLQSLGVLAWSLNGKTYFSTLSTFPLVHDEKYQGNLADDSGEIGITNDTEFPLVVSCLFVF